MEVVFRVSATQLTYSAFTKGTFKVLSGSGGFAALEVAAFLYHDCAVPHVHWDIGGRQPLCIALCGLTSNASAALWLVQANSSPELAEVRLDQGSAV